MSPEEVRKTREALGCTARQLAEALGVDAKLIFAWESGDRFPTKRHVQQLMALQKQGSLSARPAKPGERPESPRVLEEPGFWILVRKLAAHAELRAQVERLASKYTDPVDD